MALLTREQPPSFARRPSGLTLVEMMITLLVLAILAAGAIPAMGSFLEKSRLKGAAESLFNDLGYARSESLKRNTDISVRFATDGAANWCFGTDETTTCDCTITDATDSSACALNAAADGSSSTNVLKRTGAAEYPTIKLISAAFAVNPVTTFTPRRGTANAGTVVFRSASGKEIRVVLSPLGRVIICSPAGTGQIGNYPDCT